MKFLTLRLTLDYTYNGVRTHASRAYFSHLVEIEAIIFDILLSKLSVKYLFYIKLRLWLKNLDHKDDSYIF